MPLLTVLMPALNAAPTIGRAIRSTLADLPPDAQIALVDDGSTDDTIECATRAAHTAGRPRDLHIYRHDSPQGVAASLNELLQLTDSRLVARMDADDITLPGRFTATAKALARSHDFAFTQIIETRKARPRPNPPVAIRAQHFPIELLVTNPVCHPTMMARRTALDDLGGYRNVPAEDYDLWIRAATQEKRLTRLAQWGLIYTLHPQQVTATGQWHAASWTNEDQAHAYATLAQSLTGVPLRRLGAIAHSPLEYREPELAAFEDALTPLVARIPGAHGVLIRRRLRRRLAWARTAPSDPDAALTQRRNTR